MRKWTDATGRIELWEGDCLELLPTIFDDVRMVITSPPYCVGMEYEVDTSYEEHKELIDNFAVCCEQIIDPGGYAFVNFGPRWPAPYSMEGMYWDAFHNAGMPLYCQRIWKKPWKLCNSMRFYHHKSPRPFAEFENLWTFRKPPLKGNAWDPPRNLEKSLHAVWEGIETERNVTTEHCAAFPLYIPEWAMQVHCDADSDMLVVDPFAGRGTTLLAALHYGIRAIGIEMNYFDIAVDWLEGIIKKENSQLKLL